jgi:hypothetical protein
VRPNSGAARRKGFGGATVATSIEQRLQGRVTLNWLPAGLRATMWLPAAHVALTGASAPVDTAAEPLRSHDTNLSPLAGHRILVMHDSRTGGDARTVAGAGER